MIVLQHLVVDSAGSREGWVSLVWQLVHVMQPVSCQCQANAATVSSCTLWK